jgi:ABC-type multidrug transport system fused ATPase/permease subunit
MQASLPIVQFSSSILYCTEDDPFVEIGVMRIGDESGRIEVKFETQDASAEAGKSYVATQGTFIMEPGVFMKSLQVPIMQNDRWDTTLEFKIELKDEGLVGACLGRYLRSARIKILDDDAFPTNRYKDEILAEDLESIPKFGLLFEYFKVNWRNSDIRRGTIKIFLSDTVHQIYALLRLILNVYLIDKVLKMSEPTSELFFTRSRHTALLMNTACMLCPLVLCHYIDYVKISWNVNGMSRKALQSALLRKALYYDDTARAKVPVAELVLAMTGDVVRVSEKAYMSLFKLAQLIGNLTVAVLFLSFGPLFFHDKIQWTGLLLAFSLPLPLVTFLLCRRSKTNAIVEETGELQRSYVAHLIQTMTSYRMIADYFRRPVFVDKFEQQLKEHDDATMRESQTLANNNYFMPWLTTSVLAAYTVIGGMQVMDGNLSLGIFVSNIRLFDRIGDIFKELYTVCLDMQMALPEMQRIVQLLNISSDLEDRLALSLHQIEVTRVKMADLHRGAGSKKSRGVIATIWPLG